MAKFAPDVDYGVTLMPVPEEGAESATWAGGWSVVIPQGAKNPEGAWRFMQYFAGEPGQRTYTTETAHLPTINALLEDTSLFRTSTTASLPSNSCRPRRTARRCRWERATGTS